mmetsp:Transcript_28272/g.53514  ORF Transcript_28272/g.53514 Transcript_28272/m.53514 type:complete len:124 (+) Transcript_28272:155-526(+)
MSALLSRVTIQVPQASILPLTTLFSRTFSLPLRVSSPTLTSYLLNPHTTVDLIPSSSSSSNVNSNATTVLTIKVPDLQTCLEDMTKIEGCQMEGVQYKTFGKVAGVNVEGVRIAVFEEDEEGI